MKYIATKISNIKEQDILGILYGVGSLGLGIGNKIELDMMETQQNNMDNKVNEIFHIVQHEAKILERYAGRIKRMKNYLR